MTNTSKLHEGVDQRTTWVISEKCTMMLLRNRRDSSIKSNWSLSQSTIFSTLHSILFSFFWKKKLIRNLRTNQYFCCQIYCKPEMLTRWQRKQLEWGWSSVAEYLLEMQKIQLLVRPDKTGKIPYLRRQKVTSVTVANTKLNGPMFGLGNFLCLTAKFSLETL